MISKFFLTVVGLLYAGLAVYCAIFPERAAETVGFQLSGSSGRSEFMAVYGGLEMGMAVLFMLPWLVPSMSNFALLSCLLLHGNIVLFRSLAYLRYSDFDGMTHNLAIAEWAIFLISAALCSRKRS